MLLSLFSSALALTVPLRVTYTEDVVPGQTSVAGTALSATVALSNPTTGGAFIVSADELTVNRQEASGSAAVSFSADPAGSVRSWAIYALDAEGEALGDPEIVDLVFDNAGNGAIAARDVVGSVASLTVTDDTVRVKMTDGGAAAAYVGIFEITSDGSRLYTNPDLGVLDAAGYAAFQALGLDTIVALDTYRTQLEGNLSVGGLLVATDGTVERGQDLRWDLTFYDGRAVTSCDKSGFCTTVAVPSGTASYESPIGAVKKKKAEVPRVVLKPDDVTYDVWDASFSLLFAGDARDLELTASLDTWARDRAKASADVLALDPGGLGVWAKRTDDGEDTGMIVDIFIDVDDCFGDPLPSHCVDDDDFSVPNPANPPAWVTIPYEPITVDVLDGSGGLVATHTCRMYPTAGTQAGTAEKDTLVGTCTRDDGGTEVRRIQVLVGEHGRTSWSLEMAGPAFAAESTTTTCEKGGACTTQSVSVADGSIELSAGGEVFLTRDIGVASTWFDLPFAMADDVDGDTIAMTVDLLDPERTLTWSETDGLLVGMEGDRTVYTIELEDLTLAPTGLYVMRGARLSASTSAEGATLTLAGKLKR